MSQKRKPEKKGEEPPAKRLAKDDSVRHSESGDKDKKPERCFWVYRPPDTYWPPLAAFGVDDYERVQRIKKAAIKVSVERSKHDYEKMNSAYIFVALRESAWPVSFKTVVDSLVNGVELSGQTDWIGDWESELKQREEDPEQYKEDNPDSDEE